MYKKIILIAGPTASGKSKIAIQLAQKIKGEIINADSMQVYKEISILSSRPKKKDLKKVKHHLYGFLSVKKHFSVGLWLELVKKKIKLCEKNNKIPILVGGTGLYFESITKGMSKIPNTNTQLRNKIRNLQKKLGQKNFYNKLIKLDSLVKGKIESLDTQRSIRAYEVKTDTKKSIFDWYKLTKPEFTDYDIFKIFINTPREEILKKITHRTTEMFKEKCVEEVKNFLALNLDSSLSANKIIGINEVNKYLSGKLSLKQSQDLIHIKTRQYAKRQITWSRGHMKSWKKVYSKNFTGLCKKIIKAIS